MYAKTIDLTQTLYILAKISVPDAFIKGDNVHAVSQEHQSLGWLRESNVKLLNAISRKNVHLTNIF